MAWASWTKTVDLNCGDFPAVPGLLALALEVAHDVAVVSIVSGAAFNAYCESELKFRGQIEDLSRQSK